MPLQQRRTTKQAKLTYLKAIKGQGEKQREAIKEQEEKQLFAFSKHERKDYFNVYDRETIKILNEMFDEAIKEINKMYSQIDFDDLVYRFKGGRKLNFSFIDNAKNLVYKINAGETKLEDAKSNKDFTRKSFRGT